MKRKHLFPAILLTLFFAAQVHSATQKTSEENSLQKEDSNAVNALLGTGSRFVPIFVSVKMASKMKPESVASLATSMPVERAVAISKGLERDFLTEVTCHLDPVKGAPIIEKCPDELSTDVVKRLIKSDRAAVAGRLADHLNPKKLTVISKGLTPHETVQIGYTMKKKTLIAKVLLANPDVYIVSMLNECIRLSYYQLVAEVVQEMDSKRSIKILEDLKMNNKEKTHFLVNIMKHLSPGKSSELIQQCPDRLVADVVSQMIKNNNAGTIGRFSDNLSKNKLSSVSALLTTSDKIHVANAMKKRDVIAEILITSPDSELSSLIDEATRLGYKDLIADIEGLMVKK